MVKDMVIELSIENKAELEVGLKKTNRAINYLLRTGILRIPEDMTWETLEKRIREVAMNLIKLGTKV